MHQRIVRGAGLAGLLLGLSLVLAACVGGAGGSPSDSSTAGTSASASVATSPGSEPSPSVQDAPSSAPTATTAPTVAQSAPVVPASSPPLAGAEVTETANGQTLRVHAGSELKLILHNTYWQIAGSSDLAVLAPLGAAVYSGAGPMSCIPGTGCGTVTQVFRAAGLGQVTLTASRTSCGEVLQCTGTAGSFKVTIVVVA